MTTRPFGLLLRAACAAAVAFSVSAVRSPDIPFRIRMLDGGASETAAVADINQRRPASTSCPARPGTRGRTGPAHQFRELNFTNNYVDGFSDLPIDVNGDGYPDIVSVTWFARKISWWKNPGKAAGAVDRGGDRFRLPGRVRAARRSRQRRQGAGAAAAAGHDDGAAGVVRGRRAAPGSSMSSARRATATASAPATSTRTAAPTSSRRAAGPRRPPIRAAVRGRFTPDWESVNVPTAPAGAGARAAPPAATPPRVAELGFMHVADINGDGRNDVVTAAGHDYGVFWFEQGDGGKWTRRIDRRRMVAGARLDAGRSERRRPAGLRDRQALHGAQRQRSRRARAARRLLVRAPAGAPPRRSRAPGQASNGSATSSTSAGGWAAACRFRSSTSTATAISTSSAPARAGCSWRRT